MSHSRESHYPKTSIKAFESTNAGTPNDIVVVVVVVVVVVLVVVLDLVVVVVVFASVESVVVVVMVADAKSFVVILHSSSIDSGIGRSTGKRRGIRSTEEAAALQKLPVCQMEQPTACIS